MAEAMADNVFTHTHTHVQIKKKTVKVTYIKKT